MKLNIIKSCYVVKILLFFFLSFSSVFAENKEDKNIFSDQNLLERINIQDDQYILGPGDKLFISIGKQLISIQNTMVNSRERNSSINGSMNGDYNFLSGAYDIGPDGTLFLPKINSVNVEGLSLNELKDLLTAEYSKYLRFPEIDVNIIGYRNISIFVDGEVERPGFYTLSRKTYPTPTLFDGIRTASGITVYSDLSNIEIIRKVPLSKGGGKKAAIINLLKILEEKDNSYNIRLNDGDVIIVKKTDILIQKQIQKTLKLNLSPDFINVYLSGRLNNQGEQKIPKGSTLNQAINIGNPKVVKGKIEFMRFLSDGTLDRRIFAFRPNSKVGTYYNPILMNGDLIRIRNNLFSASTEVLKDVSAPFIGIYSITNLFGDILN